MTTYSLTQPLPSLVDRGYLQQGVSVSSAFCVMFQDSTGDYHVMVSWTGTQTHFHHINMTTGENSLLTITTTSGGFWQYCFDSYDDTLYMMSHQGEGYYYRYDVINRVATFIDHIINPGDGLGKGLDGRIWGAYQPDPNVVVTSIDPSNGHAYDDTWGLTESNSGRCTDIYADNTYIYCGLTGESGSGYFLDRITKSNKSVTTYWKNTGIKNLHILGHASGNVYAWFRDSSDVEHWYLLPNLDDEVSAVTGYSGWYITHCSYDAPTGTPWESRYGYQLDVSLYAPVSNSQEYSRIGYRTPVGSGPYTYKDIAFTGPWLNQPDTAVISVSNSGDIATVYDDANQYLDYNYLTNVKTPRGYHPIPTIFDLFKHSSGEIYMMGYSGQLVRYNPALSYTYTPAFAGPWDDDNPAKPNPYQINLAQVNESFVSLLYNYRGTYDHNGKVWVASSGVSVSGLLFWYDPDTGNCGSIADLQTIIGSAYKLRNVLAIQNRTKIATTAADGNIYIVDVDDLTLERTITPSYSSADVFHDMIEIDTGILLLISVTLVDGGPDTSGDYLYIQKVSTYDGTTSLSEVVGISGQPFGIPGYNSQTRATWRFHKGLDNYGWIFIGDSLYRINTDGDFTKVADVTAGRMAWSDVDLIIYGQTHFFYYPGILTFNGYTRGAYPSLPMDDDDLSTAYDSSDVSKVATDDTDMVAQLATSQKAIHQFKKEVLGTGGIITVVAQVTIPCSTSTTYLQIYNRSGTPAWDTIDSDNATGANTDFPLSATVADLTDYKDENNIVACRVYQEMQ